MRDCVRDALSDVIKDPIEFNPLDFGVLAWYDSADSATITESGGLVSEWRDKSGNGHNATQATGSLQPTASDNTMFFGQSNVLKFTAALDVRSIVIVYKDDTAYGSSTPVTSNISPDGFMHGGGATTSIFDNTFTRSQFINATHYTNGQLWSYNSSPGSLDDKPADFTVFILNTTESISSASAEWTIGADRATESFRSVDAIKELVLFDKILTSSERTQITNYLRTKWSIPFTPLELSPIAWYDASDASTITESGGLVSQWDDKSGNGNNATQATGALQPSLADNTMTFGSNRALTFTAALNVRSIIIVYKDEETSDFTTPFTRGTDTPNSWWHGSEFATNSIFRSASTVTAIKDADHYRNNVLFNYNSSPGILDDRPLDFTVFNINSTVSFNTESDVWWIGGDRNLSGRSVTAIKELVLFDKILTSAELTQITNYLATKWSITL